MKKPRPSDDPVILEGKIYALLSYLSIFCIIPLLFKKDNPFVLKHSKQGLVIFVAEVAVFVSHIILGSWIMQLGMFILGVVSFIGIIHVLQGLYFECPWITDAAEKITL